MVELNNLIIIGVGGFIGAVLRYLIGGWVQQNFTDFPAGTLTVNVLGSLFISLIFYSTEYLGLFDEMIRNLLTIGFLGSFTTMSSFNYETFRLLEDGNLLYVTLNIIFNVVGGLLAVVAGKSIVLWFGGS